MHKPLDIYQTGYVVKDLKAAVERWQRTTGVGRFDYIRHVQVDGGLYRGAPTTIDFSVAVAQTATMQIELIQQHDTQPSCYRDVFPGGGEGLHHVAILATDFDSELARYHAAGHVSAYGGSYQGKRFVYIDTVASLGIMVELVEAQD